jgi:hypothetical protein
MAQSEYLQRSKAANKAMTPAARTARRNMAPVVLGYTVGAAVAPFNPPLAAGIITATTLGVAAHATAPAVRSGSRTRRRTGGR